MSCDLDIVDQRCAVVTGAASGIGRAVAAGLLRTGWRVIGIDKRPSPALQWPYAHQIYDLANPQSISEVCGEFANMPVTAFIHAAGIMRSDAAIQHTAGEELWLLHVLALSRLGTALMDTMPDRLGRVVAISSRAAQGRAGRSLYAGSKAATEAVVRSLALSALDRGITVNAVAPGPVATAQSSDPLRSDAPVALPPLRRMITAEEVAETVMFLLSVAAGAITGQTFVQCGGLSLIPPQPEIGVEAMRS